MKPLAELSDDEFAHQVQRAVAALPDAPVALQRIAVAMWRAPAAAAPVALRATAAALLRPLRAVRTRHHLRRPWWIPLTLAAEFGGFVWALGLRFRDQKLICRGQSGAADR